MQGKQSYARIDLPELVDDRGRLLFAEVGRHIPFMVRRIFAIYGVGAGQERASHAHRTNHQFIIMLSGSCTIDLDDHQKRESARLNGPTHGFYVPPLVWITLSDFTPNAICLVLASELYSAAEYIRDHAEFDRLVAAS
jgi:hypothetical protein